MLDTGLVNSQAELALKEGVSRARITQVLNLCKLAPEIKPHLVSLSQDQLFFFTERKLRQIASLPDQSIQIKRFEELKRKARLANLTPTPTG